MIFSRRSRTSVTPARLFALLLAVGLGGFHCTRAAQERTPLRIYLEDNHAGTFQFLASTLDLDRPHVLVLVDAHADSETPVDVATLRRDLRRVASPGQLEERLTSWRRAGRIQAFDWIVPLMPSPLAQVIWISPPFTNHTNGSVGNHADASAPSESPASGFSSATLENLETRLPAGLPIVASIDLDSFAGLSAVEREESFEAVWHTIIHLPGLAAISFAVSRPWLTDDVEASALVRQPVIAYCASECFGGSEKAGAPSSFRVSGFRSIRPAQDEKRFRFAMAILRVRYSLLFLFVGGQVFHS